MNQPAQSHQFLYCESCVEHEIKPLHDEDSEIRIREVKLECPSCDYYVIGLGD